MGSRFKQIVQRVLRNGWLKLLAIVLAAISVRAIRGTTRVKEDYEIPVEVRVEPGIAILDQDVRTANVTFRGSEADLQRLDQRQIKVVVQPKAISPSGAEKVPIGIRDVEGVKGLTVSQVRPGMVTVTFDRETERRVPVAEPKVEGKPLIGKAEVSYEPRFVTIRGPRRRLERISQVVAEEAVNVDGRVASFTRRVKVQVPGDMLVQQIEPAEITVNVNIVQKMASRKWEAILVAILADPGAAGRIVVEPARVEVLLEGLEEVLEGLAPDSIRVFVDCQGLSAGTAYELPLVIHLPPGVDLKAAGQPETVKVVVQSAAAGRGSRGGS